MMMMCVCFRNDVIMFTEIRLKITVGYSFYIQRNEKNNSSHRDMRFVNRYRLLRMSFHRKFIHIFFVYIEFIENSDSGYDSLVFFVFGLFTLYTFWNNWKNKLVCFKWTEQEFFFLKKTLEKKFFVSKKKVSDHQDVLFLCNLIEKKWKKMKISFFGYKRTEISVMIFSNFLFSFFILKCLLFFDFEISLFLIISVFFFVSFFFNFWFWMKFGAKKN